MPNLSPAQESALRELAGVAEVIRGYLPNTSAFTHAHQLYSWLSPMPSSHHATPGEVDRNVNLLRADLEALASPDSKLPTGVAIKKPEIAQLLRQLNDVYSQAVQALGEG